MSKHHEPPPDRPAPGETDDPHAGEPAGTARPARDPLASELDRARARQGLFGKPFEPIKIGRFTLLEHLGTGGMGEVFSAYDPRLDRSVAIKLVRSRTGAAGQGMAGLLAQMEAERDADADAKPDAEPDAGPDAGPAADAGRRGDARLLREAQTLARLSHPNVVQIYEIGEVGGRVYVAMEHIRGSTLRAWLEQNARRGKRVRHHEVLRQFLAVGRGLEAAHRAGLVHRDFKPDNVLVAEDGRPRVVDFGLARVLSRAYQDHAYREDAQPPDPARRHPKAFESGSTWPLSMTPGSDPVRPLDAPANPKAAVALTTQGRILGTPLYMAPEQLRGELADSRSDQFSFCVALFEALYQERPFAGDTFDELEAAIDRGVIAGTDKARERPRVSPPVRKALLRGLSSDPADRFADMGQLLDALEQWPRRRQRNRALTALAVTVLGSASAWYVLSPETPEPCAAASAPIDALWSPARRAAIDAAFARTGLPYAGKTWPNVADHLDAYATSWRAESTAACQATHVHETQSGDLLDRRMACLQRGARQLDALLRQLDHATPEAVNRANAAALALPDLAICRDRTLMLHGLRLPDRDQRVPVGEVRATLARAHTLATLGEIPKALALARSQIAVAEATGYPAVHAEALFHTGRILAHWGTPADAVEGQRMLIQASDLAEGERHDELVARVWNDLALAAYHHEPHGDPYPAVPGSERGLARSDRAFAAIRRIGDPPRHLANALHQRGLLLFKANQFAEAEEHQRRALALIARRAGNPRYDRAVVLQDLGVALRALGRKAEARAVLDDALALLVEEVGSEHPRATQVRLDLALLSVDEGQLDQARVLLERVIAEHSQSLGSGHRWVGKGHLELAEVLRQQGQLQAAQDHAAEGLTVYQQVLPENHPERAAAHTRLGAIAYRRGQAAEALSAYQRALAIEIANKGEDHLDVGFARANVAEAHVVLGDHQAALTAIEQAFPIAEPYLDEMPALGAFVHGVRGRALLGLGRTAAAVTELDRAQTLFGALPEGVMAMERADVSWALARALIATSRTRGADRAGLTARARALAAVALAIYREQPPEVQRPEPAVRAWLQGRADLPGTP